MTNVILQHEQSHAIAAPLPAPRLPGGGDVNIRLAVPGDIPFIDALQKKNSKNLGFAYFSQLEANIAGGHILIAEEIGTKAQRHEGTEGVDQDHFVPTCLGGRASVPRPVGYCIAKDQYKEHENVGIVYQLAVEAGNRRGFIGATLIKEVFHRAAYGCKLFCCWCAKDLEANYFWESLGFVPLAFRTGSERTRGVDGKMGPRLQIFWQRRIREGDDRTPYWFPSKTRGGAVKADRIVLPIPPGMHWSEVSLAVLPGAPTEVETANCLPAAEGSQTSHEEKSNRRVKREKKANVPARRRSGMMWFAPAAPPPPTKEQIAAAKKAKAAERREKKKVKYDPKLIAAARELTAKYLDQVEQAPHVLLPPGANGKYEVSRQLEAAPSVVAEAAMKIEQLPASGMNLLEAA